MNIFYYIGDLISVHLMEPIALLIDNFNYELSVFWGFDYVPEYTVFFTMLAELAIVVVLVYIVGLACYNTITAIYRKVFKL